MKTWGLLVYFATAIMGVAYPAYRSVDALESRTTEDDRQWLSYWILTAILTMFERFAAPALAYIPLYAELKLLLLSWLVLPQIEGASFVYMQVRPYLVEGVNFIKKNLANITGKEDPSAEELTTGLKKKVAEADAGFKARLSGQSEQVKKDGESMTEKAKGLLHRGQKEASDTVTAAQDNIRDAVSAQQFSARPFPRSSCAVSCTAAACWPPLIIAMMLTLATASSCSR
eukprot:TRINITY_DN7448_c0_g2_i1.p1 TRINITY_DN7448_c0_g2~~TRINITY_DN7448_c0_g2_i1.p1  ORF type:complete len:229 (+),score=26.67 TRINITY_DN7448_c0_g2_i1:108-794(+)